jgi:hypothetical protein
MSSRAPTLECSVYVKAPVVIEQRENGPLSLFLLSRGHFLPLCCRALSASSFGTGACPRAYVRSHRAEGCPTPCSPAQRRETNFLSCSSRTEARILCFSSFGRSIPLESPVLRDRHHHSRGPAVRA